MFNAGRRAADKVPGAWKSDLPRTEPLSTPNNPPEPAPARRQLEPPRTQGGAAPRRGFAPSLPGGGGPAALGARWGSGVASLAFFPTAAPSAWRLPKPLWRSRASASRTPSPPTFQESIAIEQPRTDRFVSGLCIIGQNTNDAEPIAWIRSQRRQSPAGSDRRLAADSLAACRSVDGPGAPPEWSCGSGANGRTPSDKRASIKRPRSVRRP